MITEIVFIPSAPVLLTEYTSAEDVGAEVREHCVPALRGALVSGVDEVVVIDTVDRGPTPGRGSLGRRVANEILQAAGGFADVAMAHVQRAARVDGEIAALAADLAARPGRVLLLVVGDGSPRRGEKAPGHLDDRSFAVDDQWVGALRDGDTGALLSLDPELCTDLVVTGRAAWQVAALAADQMAAGIRPRLLWSGDPWGVMYAVARWSLDPGDGRH